MGKPSPGPWSYDRESERVLDASGEHIGSFEPDSAAVAISAPDLLAALKAIKAKTYDVCNCDHESICDPCRVLEDCGHNIAALIAKVEGQP